METRMQFQKNANVWTAAGQQIGRIARVVLDPATKALTHIVVRKGNLFNKEEKVVSIDLVAGTSKDQIALRAEAGDIESLPPFEETRVVNTSDNPDASGVSPIMFGSQAMNMPLLRPAPSETLVTQTEQNIPDGTVAMKEGAKVVTAEGKQAGHVERVLADAPTDRATHLLISMGMFARETKLVPIKWVSTIGEDEIHLRVKKNELEKMADLPLAG